VSTGGHQRAMREFRLFALKHWPRCQWCGLLLRPGTATVDHLWPRSQGGGNGWGNLVLSCADCNWEKGSRPAERFPLGPKWRDRDTELASPERVYHRNSLLLCLWHREPGGPWKLRFRGENRGAALKVARVLARSFPRGEFWLSRDGQEPDTGERLKEGS
jgi:hypothetical protein